MIFKEYLIPGLLIGATVACVATGFIAYDSGADATRIVWEGKINKANLEHTEKVALLERASKKAQDDNALALNEIDQKHQRERQDDTRKADTTLAAYRSDNLRLQQRFTNQARPACNGTTTGSAASVGNAADSVGLQDQDVEFLVRFADEADQVANTLRACQGVINSYQELYRKAWPDAAEAVLAGPK